MSNSAILYLLNDSQKDIVGFRQSISLLYNNYYKEFPCDLLCFYEENFPKQELTYLQNQLKNIFNVSFIKINFELPNFYTKEIIESIPKYFPHPDFPESTGFSMGYRHMCRFFAGSIFHHPKVREYKYVWRLDTDSFLLSSIKYNVFDKLKENNCKYGYINIQHDHPGVIKKLWDTSEKYFKKINKEDIFQPKNIKFHKNRVFYTNFEIFDVDWFCGKDYQEYFNLIDKTAGIYTYRWGDHSIRYIALNSLLKPEQLHFYQDIRYYHQKEYLNNRVSDTFNAN